MGNGEWGKCGVSIGQNPIQTDRQADRQTDRQTDKQTDRQGVWCTDGNMFHRGRTHRA